MTTIDAAERERLRATQTGRGLGASHQTGWTARVAELILQRSDS